MTWILLIVLAFALGFTCGWMWRALIALKDHNAMVLWNAENLNRRKGVK